MDVFELSFHRLLKISITYKIASMQDPSVCEGWVVLLLFVGVCVSQILWCHDEGTVERRLWLSESVWFSLVTLKLQQLGWDKLHPHLNLYIYTLVCLELNAFRVNLHCLPAPLV